ncbi:UDP-N-acetylmuramoyl-tripeptide--D-alanyl-D-alanine ligase [Lysobacter capsici]|uniref:UDP-N-acetylmuramoyl-tripeptide--D-alanyl-D- alanine ligase n=1 Tax=Lysobacter capsici TaxID=435897 RepID=UPI00287B710B|nr:UDP-N-acetylmuramoyl-tripeptide--D-alanyl-D-alanine ligase [Lysobacter capsici]WND79519.1 UDP-N-acetylmuramoyl-tripeptide--D-alanyl-D-alanine ligase [Lysobacter capsici]WND84715.1 UDP-N-acetylmuramoyl-tripeptide--D-alanyl-D-alanine ligase [Lysobacter capsici]
MRRLLLSEIARMTGGRLHGEDAAIDLLSTDSRALPASGAALFVALKGERFDGHDHVAKLLGTAVTGALVSREIDAAMPQVIVANTERALADLATTVQSTRDTRVIAITGSNGKTSVKALTTAILEQAAPGRTYSTPGNRNNEIGLPLAVLDAPEDALFAIYEMGAGKPGDIDYLVRVARPQVAVVNNIAPAHLERMGSLLGIADTKGAIYDALPSYGVAVINADDAFAPYFDNRASGRRIIRYGIDASADVTAKDVRVGPEGSSFVLATPQGEAPVALKLSGRHNVRNALAAAALALGADVSLAAIAAGLNAALPVDGRLITHRLDNGAVLIDDSYNANPGSTAAAIDTLAEMGGENWLVLGAMREIGHEEIAMHADIGRRAKSSGLRRLFALGELPTAAAQAFGDGAQVFDSHDALARALSEQLREGVRVLVKGSHSSAMDKIVTALLSAHKPAQGKGTTHAA